MIQERKQYIGVLSTEFNPRGEVYFIKSGSMQFKIRLLNSDDNVRSVSCFLNKFPEESMIDHPELPEEERIRAAQDWLRGRVFLLFAKQKSPDYITASIVSSIPKPVDFIENEPYVCVPVFASDNDEEEKNWQSSRMTEWTLSRSYTSYEEWLELIGQEQRLGRIYGYSQWNVAKQFVFWREEGSLFATGPVQTCKPDTGAVTIQGDMEFRVNVDSFREKIIYDVGVNPTLAFMTNSVCDEIEKAMFGITDKAATEELVSAITEVLTEQFAEELTVEAETEVEEVETETEAEEVAKKEEEKVQFPAENRKAARYEEGIIGAMYKECMKRHLNFRKRDLINFHLSVKCNQLVVLGGREGTGKSTLVDIYMEALGIRRKPEEKVQQYRTIVVRPSWQDEVNFFGKPDYDNEMYRPSESGFIETLIQAQQNPEQLFFICLDGMNMSRPQIYLAPFLAVIHKKKAQRFIQLYQSGMKEYMKNSDSYPEQVFIGDNVRVIGILNEEEEGEVLPLKMLRRVNVICMSEQKEDESAEKVDFRWMCGESKGWTSEAYNSFAVYYEAYSKLLRSILGELDELITSVNPNLAITRNEEKEIFMYCTNGKNILDSEFSLEIAMDYQIAQRVLTKVRGTAEEWNVLLGEEEGSLLYLLDGYGQISDFEESRRVIKIKQEELKRTGNCY